jgi:type II secretory ATPase GspE/PulE/Tfp pilus assembly ATPase PilB-like protein
MINRNESSAGKIHWPTPPYFRRDDNAAKSALRPCRIEFLDGSVVTGNLVAFEPGQGEVAVRTKESAKSQVVDLARVRLIIRTDPFELRPDSGALRGVGAAESAVTSDKQFLVKFTDGAVFKGRTRGWVKEPAGLFLNIVASDAAPPRRYFVPAQALGDASLGPLLGEALTTNKAISERTLSAALAKQAALRQVPLGQLLQESALVTREELETALRRQQRKPNVRLGQLLVNVGLITLEQRDAALAAQAEQRGRPLGQILVEMGAVTTTQVQAALADKLGIPMVNVREFRVDPQAVSLIPAQLAHRHQVLPLLRIENTLIIAAENPPAHDISNELRFTSGLEILPVMADGKDLKARIAKEYSAIDDGTLGTAREGEGADADGSSGRGGSPQSSVEDLTSQLAREAVDTTDQSRDAEADARVSDSALVKLVNKIIVDAHREGASDIHIESNPGKRPTRIRFRKDGRLHDYLELEHSYRSALLSRLKIMAKLDISEKRRAQDGKIEFGRFGPLRIELRIAVMPTANGLEDVVLRILGGSEPIPMDKLGMSDRNLAEIKKMVTRSYGLILVCGPTGSGKTTTLHSLLNFINQPEIKIWTAEDPIEITQAGLRQVQINAKIDWTFAAAMRSFLRADPDVIMVGEMRDLETAKIGIEASLTGHLIFSTLHTNSAAESIVRLLDVGLDQFTFSDALIGILAQRLARRLCPRCKKPHAATTAEIDELASEYCLDDDLDRQALVQRWNQTYGLNGGLTLHARVGCEHCNGGYRGRAGIHELIVATPAIKQLIHARAPVRQLAEAAQREGTQLLRHDAIDKVWQGTLDLASARAAYY